MTFATSPRIHPTALIDPTAELHETVTVGPYSIIGPAVRIDANTIVGSHVVIGGYTRIGSGNRIFQFSSVGEVCQDRKYQGEETWLEIGDDNIIREHCTLHRGTVQDEGLTQIGHRNLLMVNTHIAHDCRIGNDNTFANNAGIAGHVVVGNSVLVGGNSGVHQFCRLDSYCMVGGGSVILKDVPAFVMASGNPAAAHGMNIEGMRRRGWSKETINGLRAAYKLIYKDNNTTQQAIDLLESELLESTPEVAYFIDSLRNSTRGIVR